MVDQFAGNLDGVFNVYKAVDNRWKSPENPGNGRYGTTKMGTTAPERDWIRSRVLYHGNYKKNKNITLLTLEILCDILSCTPNDIVQFRKTD